MAAHAAQMNGRRVLTAPAGRSPTISRRARNAQLNAWNILSQLRSCPWRTGQLAKAIRPSDPGDRSVKAQHAIITPVGCPAAGPVSR